MARRGGLDQYVHPLIMMEGHVLVLIPRSRNVIVDVTMEALLRLPSVTAVTHFGGHAVKTAS